MTRRDEVSNQARSEDVRTFPLIAQIPDPQEGDTIFMEPRADFPFDIIEIASLCGVGDVEITPAIDGVVVDTDRSDSSGSILVDQPSLVTATPDGSVFEVGVNEAFTISLANVSSFAAQLVIRVKCRRTDENVVVT